MKFVLQYFTFLLLQLLLRFSLYFDIHQFDSDVSRYAFSCFYSSWGSMEFWDLWADDFISLGKISAIISTNIFFFGLILSFLQGLQLHIC